MKNSIVNDISILSYIMAHTHKAYINVQTLARYSDIHGDISILVKRSGVEYLDCGPLSLVNLDVC